MTLVDKPQQGWVPGTASFGARLALVRHRMGWNIKEAALACGVPPASWRAWELNGSSPRDMVNIAIRISKRSGCDTYWLAGFDVAPTDGPEVEVSTRSSLRLVPDPSDSGLLHAA